MIKKSLHKHIQSRASRRQKGNCDHTMYYESNVQYMRWSLTQH